MTQGVLFITPGCIDIQAFTMFGVNAKPNTNNPIGYFGTGLKYAIAVCCRLGASPIVWIGNDKYTFYVKATKFRNKMFDVVRMKREKWSLLRATHHTLPFTTELGRNWEAWQAFRELESNTRDEHGATTAIDLRFDSVPTEEMRTCIYVENTEFVQAYHDRAKTFLPEGMTTRESSETVQILDKPSTNLYFRGLRVADLQKPTMFTYNLLRQVALTEDRTIKYDFEAHAEIARHVVKSHDAEFIEKMLTAPDNVWEHGIEYDYQNDAPSDEFRRTVEKRTGAVSRSALRYYGAWAVPGHLPSTWDTYPRPWRANARSAFDKNNTCVLSTAQDFQLMIDVVDAINKQQGEVK